MALYQVYGSVSNTDLNTVLTMLTDGAGDLKTAGLVIIGIVVAAGITFFGARWLWNMFRGWMSRAS